LMNRIYGCLKKELSKLKSEIINELKVKKYDKNLNTFLQFNVINDIIAERMTNPEYYEEQEYDDIELPF